MIKEVVLKLYLFIRKNIYSCFSNNNNISGKYISHQPVVIVGEGKVFFGNNVNFGVVNSPGFYNNYAHIDSRFKETAIRFGNNININNSFSVGSEKSVVIKDNVLIGYNCNIIDSNFHDLNVDKRHDSDPNPKEVIINENVFIGNDVTILKGVNIGRNSVVASGAIVTKSFPENVIIGGCPAKIINTLD